MVNKQQTMDLAALVEAIQQVDQHLSAQAGKAVNISLTLRNWFIGLYIAEYELHGADRANYGDNLLAELSSRLKTHKISNIGRRQLYNYLSFYRVYPQIVRTVPAQSWHLLPTSLNNAEIEKVRTASA